MRVLTRLVLVPVVALFVLTACASPDDEPADSSDSEAAAESTPPPQAVATPEPFRGLPDGAGQDVRSPAGVVVGEDGLIQVVTYGSSTNPRIVWGATAEDQTVTVDVRNVPDRPATMDFVPTTSAFLLPEDVDRDAPIQFVLGDLGTVTLPTAEPGAQAWVEVPD